MDMTVDGKGPKLKSRLEPKHNKEGTKPGPRLEALPRRVTDTKTTGPKEPELTTEGNDPPRVNTHPKHTMGYQHALRKPARAKTTKLVGSIKKPRHGSSKMSYATLNC